MNNTKLSLTELNDMIPFEREIYTSLFIADLNKKAQQNG